MGLHLFLLSKNYVLRGFFTGTRAAFLMMLCAVQSFWQQMDAKVVWAQKMAVRFRGNLHFPEITTAVHLSPWQCAVIETLAT